jgi:hypothetical protein
MPRQAGGTGGAGSPQCPDELAVELVPAVVGLLAGVDHELLPHAQSRGVSVGNFVRLGELEAVALADADALERGEWSRQQRA